MGLTHHPDLNSGTLLGPAQVKLKLAHPSLFAIFEKETDDPTIAIAHVMDSRNTRVRLTAIGGTVLDVPCDPHGSPHRIYPRQFVRFTADGEFVVKPEMARSKITK